MIDIREWIWFGIRLITYAAFLFICFAVWYYWFVVRKSFRNKRQRSINLQKRSFVFHTLSFEISNDDIILLHIQLSPLEKQLIELGKLNGQKYKISSFEIQDEQLNIIFVELDKHLTIKHEYLEEKRLEIIFFFNL